MHNAHVIAYVQDTLRCNASLQTMYAQDADFEFLAVLVRIQQRTIEQLKREVKS